MKRWIVVASILFIVLLLGGIAVASYFVIYGVPNIVPVPTAGPDPLEGAIRRWRRGEFAGYDRIFINSDRFEEVMFLNFLRGRLTLSCEVHNDELLCEGFSPIRIKRRGRKYEILSTSIYLVDTTGPLGRKRKSLVDWTSKLKNMDYYHALEVCTGQIRNGSPADSLYLEMKAMERDTVVLSNLAKRELNLRFYEIFEDRMISGHICVPFPDLWTAHGRFNRYVDADSRRIEGIKVHLARKRKALKEVSRKLERSLEKIHDPLALAFYKRGLQYYSQGDLESARIFFKKALKIEPDFEQAKKSLERVETLIERGQQ